MKLIVAIVQDEDAGRLVSALMDKAGVAYAFLGKPGKAGLLNIKKDADSWSLDIPSLRDLWFKTSYYSTGVRVAKRRHWRDTRAINTMS